MALTAAASSGSPAPATSRMLQFTSAPDFEGAGRCKVTDSTTMYGTFGHRQWTNSVVGPASVTQTVDVTVVTVTNAEEPGTVTLNPARPSVGTEITATLEDDDIVDGSESLAVGQRRRHGRNLHHRITGATLTTTYTPVAADVGKYLRATATYTDGFDR